MVVFALIISLALSFFPLSPHSLLPTVIFLSSGAALHIGLLLWQRRRLRSPASDADLRELESSVHQKVVVSSRAELWQRESEDSFIDSTSNLLFDAVIVSEPMGKAMTANPDSGEVLLAFHLLHIPRTRNVYDFIASMGLFYTVAVLIRYFIVPIISSVVPTPFFLVFVFLSVGPALPVIILVCVLARYSFWRHDTAFEIAGDLYDVHPQVAKVQVEQGRDLDEDERRAVFWGVLEWEKKKRSSRRVGIAVLGMIPGFLVPLLFLSPFLYSPLASIQFALAITAVSFLGGLVLYLLLREWDKGAMREVEFSTAGAREPIWMD
jgi:hypothetical protein